MQRSRTREGAAPLEGNFISERPTSERDRTLTGCGSAVARDHWTRLARVMCVLRFGREDLLISSSGHFVQHDWVG